MLAKLVREPQMLQRTKVTELDQTEVAFTAVDAEEQSAGYQAGYSRLAASEAAAVDTIPNIPDVQLFMKQELTKAVHDDPRLGPWIRQSGTDIEGLIG